MSKNWSLILVVAFTLGFSIKAYLDSQQKLAAQVTTPLTLSGDNQQAVAIFDQADPRIELSILALHVVQMSAQPL